MKNIKRLLRLLLLQVEVCKQKVFCGMCGEIEVLAGAYTDCEHNIRTNEIDAEETQLLMKYLEDNKPKGTRMGDFWWNGKDRYNKEPRIQWLLKHINKR